MQFELRSLTFALNGQCCDEQMLGYRAAVSLRCTWSGGHWMRSLMQVSQTGQMRPCRGCTAWTARPVSW